MVHTGMQLKILQHELSCTGAALILKTSELEVLQSSTKCSMPLFFQIAQISSFGLGETKAEERILSEDRL